jgi:hypothetical protein
VLPDGDQMRAVAIADKDSKREKAWRRRFPSVLDRTQMHGTAILDCKVIDFPDVKEHVTGPMAPGARNFLASGYRAITIMTDDSRQDRNRRNQCGARGAGAALRKAARAS